MGTTLEEEATLRKAGVEYLHANKETSINSQVCMDTHYGCHCYAASLPALSQIV